MSRRNKLLAVTLTAIMVLSVMAVAPATADGASTSGHILQVDDDHGADHNDDIDNDNEYETIQGAVNDSEPGDRIEVAPGTYNENVNVDVGDIVIEGAGASQVTVVGTGGPTFANATVTLGADDIDFHGFTVEAAPQDSTPAIAIYDLIDDSHVKGVLVEDNVFVGHDDTNILGFATPPGGNDQSRDLTIRNNEFTGGTVGSMTYGFVLNAQDSVMQGNTFSTKVDISSLYVTGPDNTILDTTIEYPGFAYTGAWIEGARTTVDTMSVDGHPDAHLHQNKTRGDWLRYGVAVNGPDSTLNNVESVESHTGIAVAADGVAVRNSMGDENRNHDLKIYEDTDNADVDNFDAMSSVRPVEDQWSNFRASDFPSSGANVYVAGGNGHTLTDVTSTSNAPIGIRLEADGSTVDSAEISNKAGGPVDLDADGVAETSTTGISLEGANGNTITNSLVTHNDVGVAVMNGTGNHLVGNNPGIYNNTEAGVKLLNADDTMLADNDVQDNGVGLHAIDSDPVRAKYNNFVGNGAGIAATNSDVDATWNWFGADDGPSGPATDGVLSGSGDSISGDVDYDPFLTAPKDQVQQDPDKTQQYAHDLVTQGSQGIQTVGTPGPGEVSFQFTSGANAAVWTYDSGSFSMVGSPTVTAGTLDAYLISNLDHTDHARVVIDFSDSTPATPGAKDLDNGWNFVTAPQYGDTEDVMRTTTEVLRVAHGYDQFGSQPAPSSAPTPKTSAFSYPMGSSSTGPNLSAYSGYWVHVNGDGEITAAIPSGVTITEEEGLIVTP
jgi:parallel beta-helix repeat protein